MIESAIAKIYHPLMRQLWMILILFASLSPAFADDVVHGKVLKVLPLLLNQKGNDAVSPSLFDRDAYQAYLRLHTNEVSAVRFDISWRATKSENENLRLRAELRGIGAGGMPTQKTLETNVVAGRFNQWSSLPLAGEDFQKFGSLVAWRVTLWNGDKMLGEQKSFLW